MRVALVLLVAACGDNQSGWTPIFDGKTLDGWYSYLAVSGRDNDPNGIFQVEDGAIHILGVDLAPGQFEYGYLATTRDYEDIRVRFEYQWGPRNFSGFGPDSGFFVTAVGPDMIWPRSQECQVYRGDTGSMYLFDYATIETTIDPTIQAPTYLDGGVPYSAPRNPNPYYAYIAKDAQFDTPDDWNQVEIDVDGDSAVYIVNGNVTFRSTHRRQPSPDAPDDPTMDIPLTKGRLVIQNEGNEIYYRNIEIQQIYE
ncbi:MAG TPA: DUF1080 domain-containing protein [Kofleriaceae bacterium]|nr:DUF1080 domain-containing protein [Kofleriaceae bacterium]